VYLCIIILSLKFTAHGMHKHLLKLCLGSLSTPMCTLAATLADCCTLETCTLNCLSIGTRVCSFCEALAGVSSTSQECFLILFSSLLTFKFNPAASTGVAERLTGPSCHKNIRGKISRQGKPFPASSVEKEPLWYRVL
jgi:hypothetical protein